MDNRTLAQRLVDIAHDLEREHASLFRVRAYRRAAETIMRLDDPIDRLVRDGGRKKLLELPSIGLTLAKTIETLVREDANANLTAGASVS